MKSLAPWHAEQLQTGRPTCDLKASCFSRGAASTSDCFTREFGSCRRVVESPGQKRQIEKVKRLSPNDPFVIAMSSPTERNKPDCTNGIGRKRAHFSEDFSTSGEFLQSGFRGILAKLPRLLDIWVVFGSNFSAAQTRMAERSGIRTRVRVFEVGTARRSITSAVRRKTAAVRSG